jgi:uncharacterized membrane protein
MAILHQIAHYRIFLVSSACCGIYYLQQSTEGVKKEVRRFLFSLANKIVAVFIHVLSATTNIEFIYTYILDNLFYLMYIMSAPNYRYIVNKLYYILIYRSIGK